MRTKSTFIKVFLVLPLGIIATIFFAISVFADNNSVSEEISKMGSVLHMHTQAGQASKGETGTSPAVSLQIVSTEQTQNGIDAIKLKATDNRKHRLHQQDEFNYDQKEVEALLLGGATLEDIYRSDEIGNQWLVDPRSLIEQKQQSHQAWGDIEADLKSQTEQKLQVLKNKHKNLAAKLGTAAMSEAEQLEIYQYADKNPNQALSDMMNSFKTGGRSGLQELHDMTKKGGKQQ